MGRMGMISCLPENRSTGGVSALVLGMLGEAVKTEKWAPVGSPTVGMSLTVVSDRSGSFALRGSVPVGGP